MQYFFVRAGTMCNGLAHRGKVDENLSQRIKWKREGYVDTVSLASLTLWPEEFSQARQASFNSL